MYQLGTLTFRIGMGLWIGSRRKEAIMYECISESGSRWLHKLNSLTPTIIIDVAMHVPPLLPPT